jgi:hypothetical protein
VDGIGRSLQQALILHCSRNAVKQGADFRCPYNRSMYVIAIGWLYVTLLMAATEPNLTAGVLTFVFYGVAPLALLLWLLGTPQRRRLARKAIDDAIGKDDGADPRRDQ